MAEEAASSLLGGSNKRFCFAREDFLRENFDVDEFISACRRRVTLETLHDDLTVHYKALKNAMMELINKDYADFVSLSSSLVGMEKEIANILVPLGQLREEVSTVKASVDSAQSKLEQLLRRRADFVRKKATLERYLVISQKIDSIEQILRLDGQAFSGEAIDSSSDGSEDVLERVTSAFNELQFQVEQAEDSEFVSAITPRIAAITGSLQSGLEKSFQSGLAANDSNRLHRCLRTYAAIDRTSAVETLFRTSVVRPQLSPIVSGHSSLDDMYPAILDFINSSCRQLVGLTSSIPSSPATASHSSDSKSQVSSVQGIDFLVNAVWPELVSLLTNQAPTIFAAGNPDVFHSNFSKSMAFLSSFEKICGTQASVGQLRNHASYKQFMSKWSLSVYFQLRFQDIAWSLEEVLGNAFASHGDTNFRCAATVALWSSLQRCWSDTVYLQPLAHRFWKLTLQLLSRYCAWLTELQLEQTSDPAKAGNESGSRSSSASGASSPTGLTVCATCAQLIDLVLDTNTVLNKLPSFLSGQIQPLLDTWSSAAPQTNDGMLESRLALKQCQPKLNGLISEHLCQECLVHLEAARTVPRLYRHTNRAAPSEPSAYVGSVTRCLQSFKEQHSQCGKTHVQTWCGGALTSMCSRYKALVSDILLSVKKTEDSLQRLKRARRSVANTSASADTGGAVELSDEDKIRLQLLWDVESFGVKTEELGFRIRDSPAFTELFALVQPASALRS